MITHDVFLHLAGTHDAAGTAAIFCKTCGHFLPSNDEAKWYQGAIDAATLVDITSDLYAHENENG